MKLITKCVKCGENNEDAQYINTDICRYCRTGEPRTYSGMYVEEMDWD